MRIYSEKRIFFGRFQGKKMLTPPLEAGKIPPPRAGPPLGVSCYSYGGDRLDSVIFSDTGPAQKFLRRCSILRKSNKNSQIVEKIANPRTRIVHLRAKAAN